jgi:hypothetical protein
MSEDRRTMGRRETLLLFLTFGITVATLSFASGWLNASSAARAAGHSEGFDEALLGDWAVYECVDGDGDLAYHVSWSDPSTHTVPPREIRYGGWDCTYVGIASGVLPP